MAVRYAALHEGMTRQFSLREPAMPDLSTLALFTAACMVLTATPGPDMLRELRLGRGAVDLLSEPNDRGKYGNRLVETLQSPCIQLNKRHARTDRVSRDAIDQDFGIFRART